MCDGNLCVGVNWVVVVFEFGCDELVGDVVV